MHYAIDTDRQVRDVEAQTMATFRVPRAPDGASARTSFSNPATADSESDRRRSSIDQFSSVSAGRARQRRSTMGHPSSCLSRRFSAMPRLASPADRSRRDAPSRRVAAVNLSREWRHGQAAQLSSASQLRSDPRSARDRVSYGGLRRVSPINSGKYRDLHPLGTRDAQPIRRSTNGFCHRERGAVRTSSIPMAWVTFRKFGP